jgi:hypothetical protein
MNLLNYFISNHLPKAIREEYFSKSIVKYSGDNKIFVIGLGDFSGVITEQKKDEILKQLSRPESEVYFFTLFDSKETFQKKSNLISWGSYVWLATEPEHTIHFDNKPKLKTRLHN